jgi:methyl-accepting chemotaxis protein
VEQAAAAAESMEEQATSLTRSVSIFKLAGSTMQNAEKRDLASRPKNVSRLPAKAPQTKPAPEHIAKRVAVAGSDSAQWEEF